MRWFNWFAQKIDQSIGWHSLPRPLGLLTLSGLRNTLREQNLYDTYTTPRAAPTDDGNASRCPVAYSADGTYTDLSSPMMGCVKTRFGRNVPLSEAYPDEARVLMPNPRTVSKELLARNEFQPATSLNLLAAAWIQFMIHDWFSHGQNQKENPWQVPIEKDDDWPTKTMTVLRTKRDTTRTCSEGLPPTFLNCATHWWDGSQIYGSSKTLMHRMRTSKLGKLRLDDNGLLPVDPKTGTDIAGVHGNWWVGLSLLHTLFTREHNFICDELHKLYPFWDDTDLYSHARLITVALMAKIHTTEWTPGILYHPTIQTAMNGNWYGLQGKWLRTHFGRLSSNEALSGITGSHLNHFGVPFSLTEEFVAVYRMHPLIPDTFEIRSLKNNALLQTLAFQDVADANARTLIERIAISDLFYSFGIAHPGAITLHNYPNSLRRRRDPDKHLIDLATTEIIRDRERGIPRYNAFRKLLHRPPVKSFEELTDNPTWAEQIRKVYNNDIDQVDLMVGLYAEPRPHGFGFSDTAFRIFILMASRRLNSNPFFTEYYTPAIYTPWGMKWIDDNGMVSLLKRHFPEVSPFLQHAKNPFAPWSSEPGGKGM
jgi:hypothetical protein